MKKELFCFFILGFFLISSVSAIGEGQINIILDSENNLTEPLSNALVKLSFSEESFLETSTDNDGRYSFNMEDIYCWRGCNIFPTIYTKDIEIRSEKVSTKYNFVSSNKGRPRGAYLNIQSEFDSQPLFKEPKFLDIIDAPRDLKLEKNSIGYLVYWKGNLTFEEEKERKLKFSFDKGTIIFNDVEYNLSEDQEITLDTAEFNTLELVYFSSTDKKPNLYVLEDEFLPINLNQLKFDYGSYSKVEEIPQQRSFIANSLPSPDLSVTPAWVWFYFLDRDLNKQPVLFVHGLHGSDDWDGDPDSFNYWYDNKIPLELKDEGFESYELVWIPSNLSSRIYALALKNTLQDIESQHGASKIHVVAHSMGGLLVRSYMEDLGVFPVSGNKLFYSGEIDKVVFLGTPNHGSYLSNRVIKGERPSCLSFAGLLPSDGSAEAYQELSIGSLFLWTLNNIEVDNPQNFLSIAGVKDLICYPDDISESADINHAFDGFVTVSSASMLEQSIPLVTLKLNHASIKGGNVNNNWVDYSHDTSNDVSPIIADFFRSNNQNTLLTDIQSYLGSGEYAIFPGISSNPYETGIVIIKADADQIKIRDSSNNDYIFTLWANDIWIYFDEGGNGLAIPIGQYDVYVGDIRQEDKLMVKGAQTTMYEVVPPTIEGLYHLEIGGENEITTEINNTMYELRFGSMNTLQNTCNLRIGNGLGNEILTLETGSQEQSSLYPLQVNATLCDTDEGILEFYIESYIESYIPPCDINWSCTDWQPEECPVSEIQSRTCIDSNQCGTNEGKPSEEKSCAYISLPQTELTLNSPDTPLYSERRIPFNITTTEEVDEISYIDWEDSRPRERRLCRNCKGYGDDRRRLKSFRDGPHNITFMAIVDDLVVDEENIGFLVDSKDPGISKIEPRRNSFTNGEFRAEFKEDNPVALILYYGNNQTGMKLKGYPDNCDVDDRGKYACQTIVNLSEYDGQEIEYQFEVEDIVGRVDASRLTTVKVDTTLPVLNNPDNYWKQGDGRYYRYIYFDFNITEENFDEINYIDWNDTRPRERRFCSRLRDGICEKRKSFSIGEHNLTITIIDDAGNYINKSIEFEIVEE